MQFYKNVLFEKNKIYSVIQNGTKSIYNIETYRPKVYIPANTPSEYKNFEGQNLAVMEFNDFWEKHRYLKEFGNRLSFYGTKNNHHDWITENYSGLVEYDESLIKVAYIDLEVSSENGFPKPENATEEIQLITITSGETYHVFGCDIFVPKEKNIVYHHFNNEKEMLKGFLKFWTQARYDVLTGWYIRGFDVPYLINRLRNLFGNSAPNKLSPWNRIERDIIKGSNGMEDRETYKILGIAILDYLEVYKKFGFETLEDTKLNTVAHYELKVKKLDYSEYGSLRKLAKENFQLYAEYNIEDVRLVQRIEAKKRLLSLVFNMAYRFKVNYEEVFFQTKMWDAIIYDFLKTRKIIPKIKTEITPKNNKYEGAFVKEPKPGMYDWIVSVDATSMYPSMIMMFNISPETFRGMVSSDVETILKKNNKHLEKLQNENLAMAINGATFDKSIHGFLPQIVEELFEERNAYKNEMKKLKQQKGDESRIAMLNVYQNSRKVSINSAYGASGNPGFRYYMLEMAEAITISAQTVILWAEKYINEFFNKRFGTTGIDYVVYIDTDSLYLNFKPVVDVSKSDDENIEIINKFINDELYPYFDTIFEELKKLTNAYKQTVSFKRESIANRVVWTAKKRYIMNVLDFEGVRHNPSEIKVTGIEAIKKTTPEVCRKALNDSFRIIMEGTQPELQEYIRKFKEEFVKLPFMSVAQTLGCNGLRNYASNVHVYKKGTPMHVRAAILYNKYVQDLGLETKYESLRDGEKVKFVPLIMPNPIREDVIALNGILPPEFGLDKYVDYEELFDKTFMDPLQRVLDTFGWYGKKVDTLDALFG